MKSDHIDTGVNDSRAAQDDLGFFRFVVESLPVAVLTVDSEIRITSFNPWAVKLTGYTAEQALGRYCGEILHGGECGTECPLENVLYHHNPIVRMESTIRNSHGETIPVRMNSAVLRDASGKLIGAVEAFHDISQLKTLQREKDNFISMIAHDMKSSLMLVGSFAHLLQKEGACASCGKEKKYLRIIQDETGKLESLIEEFLVYSSLQTGKVNLRMGAVSVDQILLEICQAYEPKAAELELTLDLDVVSPLMIEGDPVHLRRVFVNLLDNAIKFSSKGGVVKVFSEDGQKGVALMVRDEGQGIPPEELPYIFDAFHRGRIGSVKGFGLGLASVKAIVEAHGGRVLVESEPGKGSQFTAIFPKPSAR